MSKLTQIEEALKGIDPAGFQRLCDSYLHARGYKRINPIGLVIGTDKVKRGTPDTLIPLDNGTYIFAEYTTQEKNVADKLLADMKKCFDESKTGIPIEKIHEFIGCHTSVLSPADEHRLIETGRQHGCIVTLFGIGPISHDLLQHFPGLARDNLGIKVDTGQIVSLDEFVSAYGQNAIATPLNTNIRFRDDEIQRGITALTDNDILIITGAPGVGKSRLALECCRRFTEENSSFLTYSIHDRGADLFEDLRVYFSPLGSYLIFVDDANRVSGFEYVLQLLHDQTDLRRIKLVVTVRDYAQDKIMDSVGIYGGGRTLAIEPLEDKHIQEIISLDFGITNHIYLERITDVSRGNPRIAIMASRIALRENGLASLADVSSIYDEYFRSIRQDIADLNDPELLRTAAILAFFRKIDRNNPDQTSLITSVFGSEIDRFWTTIHRLNDLEVVDLYEEEIARISDQVLATFVAHLAFFKDRVLDPSTFLHPSIFPLHRSHIFDTLNPILTAFDGEIIAERLRPIVKYRWSDFEKTGNMSGLLHLADAFGQLDPTATLLFVRNFVQKITSEEIDTSEIVFKASRASRPSIWTILSGFQNSDIAEIQIVLDLAFELVAKRPTDVPNILNLLTEDFGIKHTSYIRNFEVQRIVIEALWNRIQEDVSNSIFSRIFLIVAEPLLRTHFSTHESKDNSSITIRRFDILVTPELKQLRRTVWQNILDLFCNAPIQPMVMEMIYSHTEAGLYVRNQELLKDDATVVLPTMAKILDQNNHDHCSMATAYLGLLKRSQVKLEASQERIYDEIQKVFGNQKAKIISLLLDDPTELEGCEGLEWQECQRFKHDRLGEYLERYDASQFDAFISQCEIIRNSLRPIKSANGTIRMDRSHDAYQFKSSIETCFSIVYTRDLGLFVEVVSAYLARGNPLQLSPYAIVPQLMSCIGTDQTYQTLVRYDFSEQKLWQAVFFSSIPKEAVNKEYLELLYTFYDETRAVDFVIGMDYLKNYEDIDNRVIVNITEKLVSKANEDGKIGIILAGLVDSHSALNGYIREVFGSSSTDINLLKRAYFAAAHARGHSDYDSVTFNILLDFDGSFGADWIDWLYVNSDPQTGVSSLDDHRHYESLWLREDFFAVITKIIDRLQHHEENRFVLSSYAGAFFRTTEGVSQRDLILDRQNTFLKSLIEARSDDINFMKFVFGVVRAFDPERRRKLISIFVENNIRYDHFEQLPLEPNHWSWSGSEVPLLQKRIDFFESVLPFLNTLPLLDHRCSIERQIVRLREEIKREKREDFLKA